MKEILDQDNSFLSNAQTLIKINFILLKKDHLPLWTDSHFESFVRDWLRKSSVDLERLHKKDYNSSLQSIIDRSCIGENYDDINSVTLFNEFKQSVCLYLDFVQ